MSQLKVPSKLRNYQIEEFRGSGGAGSVYRAVNIDSGMHVAIKQSNSEDSFARDSLTHEARILLEFSPNHRSIPKAIESFLYQGEQFLVMEYIHGNSLAERITISDTNTEINLSMKIYWANELLSALEYLHENGLTHRDITPRNVIITEHDQIYLVDFGLAKFDVTVIRASTELYASPEQINGTTTNEQSDIYSMGTTLYHLFTGGPLGKATDRQAKSREEDRHYIDKTLAQHGIPEPLRNALIKAVALKPSERFTNAAEMRREVCLEWGLYRITSPDNQWLESGILEAENPLTRKVVLIYYWNRDECRDAIAAQETIHKLHAINSRHLPYIPYVYQRGPFFCALQDFVPGNKLDKLLKGRREPFPQPSIGNWFEQLMTILKQLNDLPSPSLRWVITPSNLVITEQAPQTLKLWQYDFTQPPSDGAYAATEEVDGPRTVSSDIYRAGAILYHLLTGRKPYSAQARLDAIQNNEADPLQIDTRIDRRVRKLLGTCLALDPEDRFENISALQQAFRRVPHEFWELPESEPPVLQRPSAEFTRNDIAALVYTLLAGKSRQVFESIRQGGTPAHSLTALTEWNSQIPPLLSNLLLSLLVPAPDATPLTVEDILERLEPLFALQELQIKLANTQTLVLYAQKQSPAQEQQLRAFQSLAQMSTAGKLPLRADHTLRVVQDIALALDSWHDKTQVPYGAISPDTIWVNDAGNAYLLVDVCRDQSKIVRSFAAPEQLKGEPVLESDHFALAGIAYSLLTEQVPPPNIPDDHQQFKLQIAQKLGETVDKLVVRSSFPILWKPTVDTTANILARGMAANPSRRFRRAEGLASILEDALKQDKILH